MCVCVRGAPYGSARHGDMFDGGGSCCNTPPVLSPHHACVMENRCRVLGVWVSVCVCVRSRFVLKCAAESWCAQFMRNRFHGTIATEREGTSPPVEHTNKDTQTHCETRIIARSILAFSYYFVLFRNNDKIGQLSDVELKEHFVANRTSEHFWCNNKQTDEI